MSSAKHVSEIVSKFDDNKHNIVRSIGFGSILDLPYFQHTHSRFYLWLLSKIKWYPKTFLLDDRFGLKMTSEHICKIIGLSSTGTDVRSKAFENDNDRNAFINNRLSFLGTDSDIISAAEDFVKSGYNCHLKSQQRDNFKIAFVIFVIGRFLAPSKEPSCGHTDLWGALENPDQIGSFNWSSYVLFHIIEAARAKHWSKLNNTRLTHITGCSLVVQVIKSSIYVVIIFCLINIF